MFLQVSVCLSIEGGFVSVHAGRPPWQVDPPAKETSRQGDPLARETPLPGRLPCQGDPPAGRPPRQGDPPGRPPCQGDSPAGRPPCQGDLLPRRPPAKETPSGPHPGRKLRGVRYRPTAKGEIEGDQIQTHIQGGNSGGSGPDPPPPNNYCCGRYASYWNAFLFTSFFWAKFKKAQKRKLKNSSETNLILSVVFWKTTTQDRSMVLQCIFTTLVLEGTTQCGPLPGESFWLMDNQLTGQSENFQLFTMR